MARIKQESRNPKFRPTPYVKPVTAKEKLKGDKLSRETRLRQRLKLVLSSEPLVESKDSRIEIDPIEVSDDETETASDVTLAPMAPTAPMVTRMKPVVNEKLGKKFQYPESDFSSVAKVISVLNRLGWSVDVKQFGEMQHYILFRGSLVYRPAWDIGATEESKLKMLRLVIRELQSELQSVNSLDAIPYFEYQ